MLHALLTVVFAVGVNAFASGDHCFEIVEISNKKRINEVINCITHNFCGEEKKEGKEPVSGILKLSITDFWSFVDYYTQESIKSGLCMVAIDETTDHVVAAIIANSSEDSYTKHPNYQQETEKIKSLVNLLDLENAFKKLEKEQEYASITTPRILIFSLGAVYSEKRGKGLMGRLWQEAEERARELGYNVFISEPTHKNTQRITDRLAYKKIDEIRYQDHEFNGKKFYAEADPEQYCPVVYKIVPERFEDNQNDLNSEEQIRGNVVLPSPQA